MPTAAEVGPKYDLLLNSQGYRFLETDDSEAAYGFTPTFAPRRADTYGDNQFDFWLTYSQNDFSLGEGQRFYRVNDDESRRRVWQLTGVDVDDGAVTRGKDSAVGATTDGLEMRSMCAARSNIFVATATNLLEFTAPGTQVSRGAHGLGANPARFGLAGDGPNVYISSESAAKVRKWNGSAFSDFASSSGADAMVYLNNTLFGFQPSVGKLVKWDTTGAVSTVYPWKDGSGNALACKALPIVAFGGKVAVLVVPTSNEGGGELWLYDGVAPTITWKCPDNFTPTDMCAQNGGLFIAGTYDSTYAHRAAVYYYVNGSVGLLWQSPGTTTTAFPAGAVTICPFQSGLLFNDPIVVSPAAFERIMFYDLTDGSVRAVHYVDTSNNNFTNYRIAAQDFAAWAGEAAIVERWPDSTATPIDSAVYTSLIDFDTSLTKYFKSVNIEFEGSGSSGTMEVYYRLNNLNGSYTLLSATPTSGTEIALGQSGRSISIGVVFDDSSASDPVRLKRVFVRAAPILDTYKRREYVLDLSGKDGAQNIQLRDGTIHTKDGLAMAQDLNTAAVLTTPFSITDRFGTFTGLIEPDGFELKEVRPEVFVARVRVREV